jgi:hypothetical protein
MDNIKSKHDSYNNQLSLYNNEDNKDDRITYIYKNSKGIINKISTTIAKYKRLEITKIIGITNKEIPNMLN